MRYRIMSLAALCALASACSRATFSASVGEPVMDVDTRFGRRATIPNPGGGSVIIGLAQWPSRGLHYARVSPGNRVVEFDARGQVLRSFATEGVPAGCGVVSDEPIEREQPSDEVVVVEPPEVSAPSCGLAIRHADGHLFLDHPNAAAHLVTEVDQSGKHIRDIQIQSGAARGTGGLGYHQHTNLLYVLYQPDRTIAEVELSGRVLREIRIPDLILPGGLDVDSSRNELVLPGHNGTHAWIYDMNGRRLRTVALGRSAAGAIGGVGTNR